MTEIEKLIKRLRHFGGELGATPLNNVIGKYMLQAADALEKLQVESEQAKAERDAAVERIREWEKFDTYLFIHNFITPEKWRGQKEG